MRTSNITSLLSITQVIAIQTLLVWGAGNISFAAGRASEEIQKAATHHNNAFYSISGKVTDEKGEGLPGVSILLKGTQSGTLTDSNGAYSFQIPDSHTNPVLVFSFVGYLTQEISVLRQQTVLDVRLVADVKSLDELVVIGYGTAKKSDLTGSVSRVSAETFKNQPMTQVTDMLTGTVAGFYAN